jgi:hypothetical protein
MMPEGMHPLPPEACRCGHGTAMHECRDRGTGCGWCGCGAVSGGWASLPFVDIDGKNWPLDFAAKMLDIPLKDLQDLVRISGLPPAGVIRMSDFSRKGRQPRAYPADKLILLTEEIRELRDRLTATA